MVVSDLEAAMASATYTLGVSLVVLGLLYWRRGLDRPAGVACLLLYLPSLALY